MNFIMMLLAVLWVALGCKPQKIRETDSDLPGDGSNSQSMLGASLVDVKEQAVDASGRKIIRVCVDEAETKPFSYVEQGVAKGFEVDVARDVLGSLGYAVEFKFLPWKRCVDHEVKSGASDTALSAAWTAKRSEYLWYPDDAAELGPKCTSPHALICNGPVLLVPADSKFEFKGDVLTVPQPIRVTYGYAQAGDYRARGMTIDEGPGAIFNIGKMVRDGSGSVLVWLLSLAQVDPELKRRIRIVDGFSDLSNGFLPIAKNGRLTREEALAVWDLLAKRRASPDYERRLFAAYGTESAPVKSP